MVQEGPFLPEWIFREGRGAYHALNLVRSNLTGLQNDRDHRKIIFINETVAFTDGFNLANEYINEIKKRKH